MTERRETLVSKMVNLDCVIGRNTNKQNTIVMSVGEEEILEAAKLSRLLKSGKKPEKGLIRFELVAVYAEEDGARNPDGTPYVSVGDRDEIPHLQRITGEYHESTEEKIESMTDELDEVLDADKD